MVTVIPGLGTDSDGIHLLPQTGTQLRECQALPASRRSQSVYGRVGCKCELATHRHAVWPIGCGTGSCAPARRTKLAAPTAARAGPAGTEGRAPALIHQRPARRCRTAGGGSPAEASQEARGSRRTSRQVPSSTDRLESGDRSGRAERVPTLWRCRAGAPSPTSRRPSSGGRGGWTATGHSLSARGSALPAMPSLGEAGGGRGVAGQADRPPCAGDGGLSAQ